jgi:hypothetical protein
MESWRAVFLGCRLTFEAVAPQLHLKEDTRISYGSHTGLFYEESGIVIETARLGWREACGESDEKFMG